MDHQDQCAPTTLRLSGPPYSSVGDASQHSDPATDKYGWLMQAWAKIPTLVSLDLPIPKPRMPCLALQCDTHGRCTARRFRVTELGANLATIKPGSHSFVRMPGEDFIRASILSFPFGKASGHPMLSDEKQVLFAGEVEVAEDGQLIRWSNVSGTYRFDKQHAVQAELPLDSFWGLVDGVKVPMQAEESDDWMLLRAGLWLHKCEETAQHIPDRVSHHQALLDTKMHTTTKPCSLLSDCCRCGRARNCTLVCSTMLIHHQILLAS